MMEAFEDSLARAGDAVGGLADGPGLAAAEALEQAFGRAGQSIEAALSKAARAGEFDFQRMTQTILADLARITVETALTRSGLLQAGQAMTLNMTLGQTAGAGSLPGRTGEIAKAVAKAAARGGRFQ